MKSLAFGAGASAALASGAETGSQDKTPLVARQVANPDRSSFVRRADSAATILGDYLYIVGGGISQHLKDQGVEEDANISGVNASLSLSLKEDWSPENVKYNVMKADDFPTAIGHALWSDETKDEVIFWGGRDFDSDGIGSGDVKLWTLKADGKGKGSWSAEEPPSDIKRTAFGGFATCDGYGWMVGGHGERDTDQDEFGSERIAVPGLISYNLATGKFRNQTTKGLTDSGNFQKGSALCVKMEGKKPKVFVIGGAEPEDTAVTDNDSTNISFDYAHFWDPADDKWYRQETQGTIPPARQGLCAVGVQGPNGTYEIFMYGGFQEGGGLLSDVWVLSIPAFRWFKADTQSSPNRLSAACVRRGSQMIAVGGNDIPTWNAEDPFPQGIGILDLNDVQWKGRYEAKPPAYEGPSMVRQWYRERGYDTIPWESNKVKSFFLKKEGSNQDNSDDRSSPEPSATPGAKESDEEDDPSSIPAIVGSIVGGVSALVLVALAGWYFRRRRRRQPTFGGKKSFVHEADEGYAVQELSSSASYGAICDEDFSPHPDSLRSQRASAVELP